jgi:hypothetical protein
MKRFLFKLVGWGALLPLASVPIQGQAFSIPTSNKLIEMDLVIPGGREVKIFAREGEMSTIKDASRDYEYALIVTLDRVTSLPKLTLLEITNLPDGGQRVEKLGEQRDLILGARGKLAAKNEQIEFRVLGIETGSFSTSPLENPLRSIPSPSQLKQIYAKAGGTCCVTCDDITVCAASVRLGCGSCDSSAWGGAGSRPPV